MTDARDTQADENPTQPTEDEGKPRRRRRRRIRRPRTEAETRPGDASEATPAAESEAEAVTEPVTERAPEPSRPRPSQEPRPSKEPRERSESGALIDARSEPDALPAAEVPPAAAPSSTFRDLDLPREIQRGLDRAGYEQPTEIQERMIPIALEGANVVARSRTGTGKTCAFLVPAFAALDEVRNHRDGEKPHGPVRVLAVVPTRELASQVALESERLSHFLNIRTACVYGGTRLRDQVMRVPESAVVVGTPGRLLDHLRRRTFDGRTVEVLILDEVDRMYDLGFRDDVDRIIAACSERKQTLLVSATLNEDVEALIRRHVKSHEQIEIESRSLTVDEVHQAFYVVEHDRKRELLMALLRHRDPDRTIVFTRTRFTADRVAYVLQKEGLDAHEIHSGLPQRQREQILKRFREGKLALLVATDVAARGLDIEGVDHVVNYDIPQAAEDYVHRVGRTARMGKKGWAVTLVTPDDGPFLTQIEKLINKEIRQERFEGFELPVPPGRAGAETDAPAEGTDEDGGASEAGSSASDKEGPKTPYGGGIPRWSRPGRRR